MDPLHHFFSDGDNSWEVYRLWEAAFGLPVEEVLVQDLLKWASDGDPCQTPQERANEISRVLLADLNYPIILTPEGWIADGVHRLVKCLVEDRKTIKVVRLPVMPEPMPE